jgi:hypothetical protein
MLAYDYPLIGLFMTMLWVFLWIVWLFLLFRTIIDIFRSQDMGGWGKAAWLIFVIILPYLGVLVYVIARGRGMADRDVAQAQAQEEQFKAYVRDVSTSSGGSADELQKLADLRDRGVISEDEFQQQKSKILA